MDLDLSWLNILILFGAIQALIFGILVLFNRKHPGSAYLGCFMFVLSYNGFETFGWSSGFSNSFIFFDLFPFVLIYAIGPSLYLYVTSLIHPERKVTSSRVMLYYSPAVFQFSVRLIILIIYFSNPSVALEKSSLFSTLYNAYHFYSEPLSLVTFLFFLGLTVRTFLKYSSQPIVLKSNSRKERQNVKKWIRSLLIWLVIFGISWTLTLIAPEVLKLPIDTHYYPIELLLVLFTYWMAIAGYYHARVIQRQTLENFRSTLTQLDVDQLVRKVNFMMEEQKLYLDQSLSLNSFAAHLNVTTKTASTLLNQHYQKSFNDFVNGYRVHDVCEKLMSIDSQHLTITGMALESGFNSAATFHRAFKSVTGKSPKEYLMARMMKT